jgi:hypothetical protein
MAEKTPAPPAPETIRERERREDSEGIPGYGQPPPEVRTLHPERPAADPWGPPPASKGPT